MRTLKEISNSGQKRLLSQAVTDLWNEMEFTREYPKDIKDHVYGIAEYLENYPWYTFQQAYESYKEDYEYMGIE
jgi:hypothetical protein